MISVAIIAKNAANTISDCIRSVKDLTDDIVVIVDDCSSDQTQTIAQACGAKTFIHKFSDYSAQKNFAVSKTKYDWVFSLDADELSTNQLNQEILQSTNSHQFTAYKIPRLNIIFNQPMYHTNWGPADDCHIWLFNKRHCRWGGLVHEEVIGSQNIGKLSNYKVHHSYTSVEEFIHKLNRYTTFESKSPRLYSNPIWDFIRRYFIHQGYLDGWHGLFLSYLMMIYHLTTWTKKSLSS